MQFDQSQAVAQDPNAILDVAKELPESMTNADSYREKLKQLPEVQHLTDEINIQDSNTIANFGTKPSEELSKISDELLRSMKTVRADEASAMLDQLTKIMDRFDIKEVEDPEKAAQASALTKLFRKAEANLQKLFEKYDNMGKEVDKIYVILNQYKSDIQNSNNMLDRLFKANMQYYEQLEKYIAAGELGLVEIDNYKASLQSSGQSPEQIAMMISKLDTMRNMLEQRVYDLRIAENVAMQTSPMIQTMETSNFNLMVSIQSAFITTLPIFKNCLISAMQLKQQNIQQKSIQQLNNKTNELLMRNAQNTANQSVAIARMANSSGVNIETLQKSYETIKKGIEDTKAIEREMATERNKNTQTLEGMKGDMKKQGWA